MKVKIEKGKAQGTVIAPPSKSMAHRLLILAGLSGSKCIVHGIADSQDMLATVDCLRALGAELEQTGDTVTVTGIDVTKANPCDTLKCRESGSTLRFFIPMALMTGEQVEFCGSERLMERPLGIYEEICKDFGFAFEREKGGLRVCGRLKPGTFEMDGNVSSQFITGLLMVLPLLPGDSLIKLRPPVESRSYINMTMEALQMFGASAEWKTDDTILVKGNQSYRAEEVFTEGDYSNAAFFEALNHLGSKVKIENLKENSLQGDRVYRELFARLDGPGAEMDISDCPDLAPVLFAVAAAKYGGKFKGTDRLKIKESSRGEVMAEVLDKFGVKVIQGDNEITVMPGGLRNSGVCAEGHNDHRIVMSEAVLMTLTGGIIEGAEAVSKSFPDFFDKLVSLGIEVKKIED